MAETVPPAPAPRGPAQISLDFAASVSAGELVAATSHFAADACFLNADGEELRGRTRIGELLAQLLSNRPSMEVEIGRVIEGERVAVASERWRMRLPGPEGTELESEGVSTVVFRRDDKAGWQILFDAPWGL